MSGPQRKREKEKARAAIVKFAVLLCSEPETMDHYAALKGTNSAAAPGSFMCLYEAVEDYRKPAQARLRKYIERQQRRKTK